MQSGSRTFLSRLLDLLCGSGTLAASKLSWWVILLVQLITLGWLSWMSTHSILHTLLMPWMVALAVTTFLSLVGLMISYLLD
jgi:hypothetical protein